MARMFEFIDNELMPNELLATQYHLMDCDDCTNEHQVRQALKDLVRKACAVSAPHHLRERVVASLEAEYLRYAAPAASQ